MDILGKKLFKNKTFGGLLEEIYNNQKARQSQVTTLINQLKPLMQDIGDATLLVPLIKDYMDIGVKNDDALLKMAGIIQKAFQNASSESDFSLSEEEKEQLMEELEKLSPPSK